jgi:hypothetical protein
MDADPSKTVPTIESSAPQGVGSNAFGFYRDAGTMTVTSRVPNKVVLSPQISRVSGKYWSVVEANTEPTIST